MEVLLKLFPVPGTDVYSLLGPRASGLPSVLLSIDRPLLLSGSQVWDGPVRGGACPGTPCPASVLSLQEQYLRRYRVPVPQTHALQEASARLRRVVATHVGPRSLRAVPSSPASTVLCVCPRVQIPTTSAAIACLGSKAHAVSWTSTNVHPGPATTELPAATWLIATSATAPLAMQVMALAIPGGGL